MRHTHRCLECIEEDITNKERRKKLMLAGGLLMIIVGLSTAAAGIVAGIPSEGVTVVFPFIVGDVSPWVAGLYSLLFFLTLSTASFVPWYIHTREKPSPRRTKTSP